MADSVNWQIFSLTEILGLDGKIWKSSITVGHENWWIKNNFKKKAHFCHAMPGMSLIYTASHFNIGPCQCAMFLQHDLDDKMETGQFFPTLRLSTGS